MYLRELLNPSIDQSCGMERTVKPLIKEGGIPFLPEDIMVNILKRLPVKSLIRFQCVCKHWKNLIKTPYFIADHLHHSSHQKPSLLLRCRCFVYGFRWVLLDSDMRELVVRSSPLINSLPRFCIYASSYGLLCLKGEFTNSILVWNPATREVRQVPITNNDFQGRCCIGFGFSPIVNDYKIVVIYTLHDDQFWNDDQFWSVDRVEVYSLCTKSWKEVDIGNLEGLYVNSETVSVNGDVFWFGLKSEGDGYCWVVSFDIASEVFTLIPMPAINVGFVQKLTVYENNLAVLRVQWNAQDEQCLKLWVLEESSGTSGERWTWTNKYSNSHCPALPSLFPCTTWSNEIICDAEFTDEDDGLTISLYLFNLASNEFKTLAIRDCDSIYGLQIHNYFESLVSIGNIP